MKLLKSLAEPVVIRMAAYMTTMFVQLGVPHDVAAKFELATVAMVVVALELVLKARGAK